MNILPKIQVDNISKVYKIYRNPVDQLREAFSIRKKKYHDEFYALKNVSFAVDAGEIVGIMGRNGAGKSTLLKIITGILSPTEGEVKTSGRISSLLELGTGFNMELSGLENVYFYGTIMGLTKSEIEKRINSIIEFAEIGDFIHQPVKTYSSGMFARLAFSCAINVDPEILIVDEILSVGDIRFQAKCFKKFKEFKQKGVTIIYVGHDVSLMKSFCNRALWMDNGKIIMEGDPAEVAAKYVEFMYVQGDKTDSSYQHIDLLENKTEPADNENPAVANEKKTEVNQSEKLFPKAIAHWGTHIGMVQEAFVLSENGDEKEAYSPDETIIVGFVFEPNDIDLSVLSVAISIKNTEGTDLIVKTSYDEEMNLNFQNGKKYKVCFRLKTYLAVGEYYLVIAIENRKETVPLYFEYIDGAAFFKVFTRKAIYGKVDLPTVIDVYEVK